MTPHYRTAARHLRDAQAAPDAIDLTVVAPSQQLIDDARADLDSANTLIDSVTRIAAQVALAACEALLPSDAHPDGLHGLAIARARTAQRWHQAAWLHEHRAALASQEDA